MRQHTVQSIFAAAMFVFGLAITTLVLSGVATQAAFSRDNFAVPAYSALPENGRLFRSSVKEPAQPAAAGWADIQSFPTYQVDVSPTPPPGSGVLKAKRVGAAAYPPNGKLYVLGGRHGADGQDVPLRDIWEYDPA